MAIIAIDFDEVLVPTAHYFVDAYNNKYGTRVDFEDQHLQQASGSWEARDDEELLARLELLRNTSAYRSIAIAEEDREVLHRLSRDHELHLVTARMPREERDSREVIERDVPGVFRDIHFVGFSGSKGAVVSELGADFLVDDSVRHLQDAIALGLSKDGAILFGDFPWSRDIEASSGFVRCNSWTEVEKRVHDVVAGK